MSGRLIGIGDIHGCSAALAAIINAIDPRSDDTLVALGDFVDRGLDSKGVLDMLIHLEGRCRLVAVVGNHDELMLAARASRSAFRRWLEFGGQSALDSYGDAGRITQVPATHFRFLERCRAYFETDTHVFVHAGYRPDLPFDRQDSFTLRWRSLLDGVPAPHTSGKTAVVGHTPQPEVLDAGHLLAIDTGAGLGGWLTALDVRSRETWQADERGRLRGRGATTSTG